MATSPDNPASSGTAMATTIATPSAHFKRVHRSGSVALRHAATGPMPSRNASGAIAAAP